jgi:hypothetical protein
MWFTSKSERESGNLACLRAFFGRDDGTSDQDQEQTLDGLSIIRESGSTVSLSPRDSQTQWRWSSVVTNNSATLLGPGYSLLPPSAPRVFSVSGFRVRAHLVLK